MPSAVKDPQVAGALDAASAVLDRLTALELAPADITDSYALIREIEVLGRRVRSLQTTMVNTIDRSGMHQVDGHASGTVMVRYAANLSIAGASRRDAAARVLRSMPMVAAGHADGAIGESQVDRIGRTLSNPRVREAFAEQDATVAILASRLPYPDFDAKLTNWERLEDQDGARDRAERTHQNRNFRIHADYDGTHDVGGHYAGLEGAEMKAIHERFYGVELEADWAEARERLGDAATYADLRRTHNQRSADAALAAWRAANQAQADAGGSLVVTNIVVDHETLDREVHHACGDDLGPDPRAETYLDEALAETEEAPPAEPRSPGTTFTCRTADGVPLHPSEALAAAFTGHVRRVVFGADGVVLDMGRLRRLFRGPQRAAVMLSAQRCPWPGCLVPQSQCQADHLDAFNGPRQGSTDPGNGAPACGRHNRLKEQGFRAYRDDRGRIHVIRPDGTEII